MKAPATYVQTRNLIFVASPVKDVTFGGDLPVEVASVEFTVKDTATPPAGLQSFSLSAMMSAEPVSGVVHR